MTLQELKEDMEQRKDNNLSNSLTTPDEVLALIAALEEILDSPDGISRYTKLGIIIRHLEPLK